MEGSSFRSISPQCYREGDALFEGEDQSQWSDARAEEGREKMCSVRQSDGPSVTRRMDSEQKIKEEKEEARLRVTEKERKTVEVRSKR